jgi:NADH:ubiquinone oxidoreductase subunit 6 (subunit J)
MFANIYLRCLLAPLLIWVAIAALLLSEPNEFARLGQLIVLVIAPLALLTITITHLRTSSDTVQKEHLALQQSKRVHPLVLQLLLFLSVFVADWFYPLIVKEFGLKKYVYPAILSVLAIPIAVLADAESGDASEFFLLALLPTYVVVHCVSWFHVNLVRHRASQWVRRDEISRRSRADAIAG